jgi:hypothetical protein
VPIPIVPLHVTFFIPPGRFTGTGKLRPEKKVLPLRGGNGTIVVEFPLASNVVLAMVTAESNVTVPFGTLSVMAGLVGVAGMKIVCPVNVIVTDPVEGK